MPDTAEGKTLLAHLTVLVKWLLFMCVIITVLVVGSLARSFVVQDAADQGTAAARQAIVAAERSDTTSQEARTAAIEARDELRNAINAAEASGEPDVQNQAIIDALAAIARIEEYLCGGPCPTSQE